jgi:HK97 family phage portal protein
MKLTDALGVWARSKVAGWILRASPENPSTSLSNPDSWLIDWMTGGRSAAGISMNESKALSIGAVYTAVRILSGTIGSLPLHVYRRDSNDRREFATSHWAYALLRDSPNEYHTSIIWRELMMAHLLLWGNAYNRIEWIGNGSARNLYPLMPWDVTPRRLTSGAQVYDVQLAGGGKETLPSDEILHIPGLMYDGIKGVSVISKMRDSAGLAKAAEEFGSKFFANGARPGVVLEVPGRMKEDAQKKLAQSVNEKFTGENAFRAMVLEEGAKLHTVQMPLQDAQFLETRKYQRSEILGWYGVPPHLGGDTERSTSWGTGIEQQDIGYAKHTITPWCVRIEQEINRKLFGRGSGIYAKFNLDGLMRGDFKSRMDGYRIAVGAPFLTRNEARRLEDWNTITDKGMDEVITPMNMAVGAEPPTNEPAPTSQP